MEIIAHRFLAEARNDMSVEIVALNAGRGKIGSTLNLFRYCPAGQSTLLREDNVLQKDKIAR